MVLFPALAVTLRLEFMFLCFLLKKKSNLIELCPLGRALPVYVDSYLIKNIYNN